jgi:hypothetical protein
MGVVSVIIFAITYNYVNFVISGFCMGLIICVLMFLFVPESPRFYVATGKSKKALGIYKYLAKLHPSKDVKRKI